MTTKHFSDTARRWACQTQCERHDRDVREGVTFPSVALEEADIEKVTFEVEDEGADMYGHVHVYLMATVTLTRTAQRRLHLQRRWLYLTFPRDGLEDLLADLVSTAQRG